MQSIFATVEVYDEVALQTVGYQCFDKCPMELMASDETKQLRYEVPHAV